MILDFCYEPGPSPETVETVTIGHRIFETWSMIGSEGHPVLVDAHLPRSMERLVVMAHGADNSRKARYVEVSGKSFTRHGTGVIAMDAPRHGDRTDAGPLERLPGLQPALLQEWVRDHRLLLDVLVDRWPEIPLGFAGFSMGGLFGVPLLAVEERFRSGAIALAGSTRVSYPERVEMDESLEAILEQTDPATYAPAVGERPVLLLCADADELVSPDAAHALYDRLTGPKELVFMPGTHTEWERAARWFRRLERFFGETLG